MLLWSWNFKVLQGIDRDTQRNVRSLGQGRVKTTAHVITVLKARSKLSFTACKLCVFATFRLVLTALVRF